MGCVTLPCHVVPFEPSDWLELNIIVNLMHSISFWLPAINCDFDMIYDIWYIHPFFLFDTILMPTFHGKPPLKLTHWGRVTYICVGKTTIIGSDNGLSPCRRQAIIWTNAGILLIGTLGTNFSENSIEILTFSFTKMRLKISSGNRRPFCLGLNVLRLGWVFTSHSFTWMKIRKFNCDSAYVGQWKGPMCCAFNTLVFIIAFEYFVTKGCSIS